jgi:hypothetical protein
MSAWKPCGASVISWSGRQPALHDEPRLMTLRRCLFGTLQHRLLFTHMLVTIAVLFVATLLVLVIQAPLRLENMVQRMAEWLQPTIMLARNNFTDALTNTDSDATNRFLDYLRSQADAQNARILLVAEPAASLSLTPRIGGSARPGRPANTTPSTFRRVGCAPAP